MRIFMVLVLGMMIEQLHTCGNRSLCLQFFEEQKGKAGIYE